MIFRSEVSGRILVGLLLAGLVGMGPPALAGPVALPKAVYDPAPAAPGLQTIVLAGGCFWGVQAVFQYTEGVVMARSGYSGGEAATARYEDVQTAETGHAESVEVRFDPAVIPLGEVLRVFFSVAHDPTQVNRQYPDIGPQYRSAIFYASEEQKAVAEAYIAQLDAAGVFEQPIATTVDPLDAFYPAENYHQDYVVRYPTEYYIRTHDLPKIAWLRDAFPEYWRERPVTVASAKMARK